MVVVVFAVAMQQRGLIEQRTTSTTGMKTIQLTTTCVRYKALGTLTGANYVAVACAVS